MAWAAPDIRWILLTRASNHDELLTVDASNVSRRDVIDSRGVQNGPTNGARRRLRRYARRVFHTLLPGRGVGLRARVARLAESRRKPDRLVCDSGADWLFCPFTTPTYAHPNLPTLVTVDDPHHPDIASACKAAERVICLSDCTRDDIVRRGLARIDKTIVIKPGILEPRPAATEDGANDAFLLCPEPHNREMLLTAFGIFRSRHPDSKLALVFEGDLNAHSRIAAEQMGLSEYVQFVQADNGLMDTCHAVIVPSLSEGIAWSVADGIAADKPVLCSDVATSRELAGDAALYFDPRRPLTIADTIETAAYAPDRMTILKRAAQQRRSELIAQSATMVEQFLAQFRGAAVTG